MVVASLFAEHSLWPTGSIAVVALLLCGLRDLPRPGIEHKYPASAGGLFTPEAPGKTLNGSFHEQLETIPSIPACSWVMPHARPVHRALKIGNEARRRHVL